MSSNKPVPSRAAIHALRGLVLGTSCSVALLAEERRRRLKTVRAAAENARKIHAAKAHRRASAADGLATWEARALNRNDEYFASAGESPSPRNFGRANKEIGHPPAKGEQSRPKSRVQRRTRAALRRRNTKETSQSWITDAIAAHPELPTLAQNDGLASWLNHVVNGAASPGPTALRSEIDKAEHDTVKRTPATLQKALRTDPLASNIAKQLAVMRSAKEQTESHSVRLDSEVAQKKMPEEEHVVDTMPRDDNFDKLSGEEASEEEALEKLLETDTLGRSSSSKSGTRARLQSGPKIEDMANVGDGLALWAVSLQKQDNNVTPAGVSDTTPRALAKDVAGQEQVAEQTAQPEPHMEELANAGDGLAMWDFRLRQSYPPESASALSEASPSTSSIAEPGVSSTSRSISATGHLKPRALRDQAEQVTFLDTKIPAAGADLVGEVLRSERLLTAAQSALRKSSGQQPTAAESASSTADLKRTWQQGCLALGRLIRHASVDLHGNVLRRIQTLIQKLRLSQAVIPMKEQEHQRLQFISHLQARANEDAEHLDALLKSLIVDGEDWLGIFTHFTAWATQKGQLNVLQVALQVVRQDDCSPIWQNGSFVASLFKLCSISLNPIPSRDTYAILQQAGLNSDSLSQPALAEISAYLVDIEDVAQQNDHTLAILRDFEEKGVQEHSCKIAQALAVRDAMQMPADVVLSRVQKLTVMQDGSLWLRSWRVRLTDLFFQSNAAAENEKFLRGLHDLVPFEVKTIHAMTILKHHGDMDDLEKSMDWLRFCIHSAPKTDTGLVSELLEWLEARWSVSPSAARSLREDIGIYMQRPSGRLGGGQAKQNNTESASDRALAKRLQQFNESQQFGHTIRDFKQYIEGSAVLSQNCLRLALTACLSRDGPHSEEAKQFVALYHAKGHDVTDEIRRLVAHSLHVDPEPGKLLKIVRLKGHDLTPSLYSIAARNVLDRGMPKEAVRICKRAAAEYGGGKLGFDQYNFSQLVRAYAFEGTSEAYRALDKLVTSFAAEPRWWHRSAMCKESLKHARKAVLQPPKVPVDRGYSHSRELALVAIDKALSHVAERRALASHPVQIVQEVLGIFGTNVDPGNPRLPRSEKLPIQRPSKLKDGRATLVDPGLGVRAKEMKRTGRTVKASRTRSQTTSPGPRRALSSRRKSDSGEVPRRAGGRKSDQRDETQVWAEHNERIDRRVSKALRGKRQMRRANALWQVEQKAFSQSVGGS